MLNEDYYENLDVPKLNEILDQASKDLVAGKVVGKTTRKEGVWP
jgi:hypothetical protein